MTCPTQRADGPPGGLALLTQLESPRMASGIENVSCDLPLQPTPFVGRDRELADVAERLRDPTCRLLTIVGPGGIGKTRLALHAATEQQAHFADGVCFVDLVPVASADLLASAIAASLRLTLHGPEDPRRQLIDCLRERRMLLVLDNFELLLDGAGLLVDLLAHAPRLKLLVTSRERLNVREEWLLPIEGLSYPAGQEAGDIDRHSAIRLFMQSAQRTQPAFSLSSNPAAVSAICRRVEGMPLALELAASWLRALAPDDIVAQIDRGIDFLALSPRNQPQRHASMRAVFDGSWVMLSEEEKAVLTRLAVFRGGFDQAAAAHVAGASLLTIAALIDKSLVRTTTPGRYDLHELLRQYSAEKLAESGETSVVARRHLAFFVNLAMQAEADIYGPKQIEWFDRLEIERGNLHAALQCALDQAAHESGLQLAAALGWFWQLRAHLHEGGQWFEKLLNAGGDVPDRIRAWALHRASEIETQLNNSARAQQLGEEALALARVSGDKWNTAWALAAIGLWGKHGAMRIQPFEEALGLFRELEDGWGISHALRRLSLFLEHVGESARAARAAAEALSLARAAQDAGATAWSLYALGFSRWRHDNNGSAAMALLEESLPLFRATRDVAGLAIALDFLGALSFIHGDGARADSCFEENLNLSLERHWSPSLAVANSLAGGVVAAWQRFERASAIQLLARLDAHRDEDPAGPVVFLLGSVLQDIRLQRDDPCHAGDIVIGRAMTVQQAAAVALRSLQSGRMPSHAAANSGLSEPLSKRELEVMRLVSQGLSNAEIAQRLYVAVGTVKIHTRKIYGKLGVSSRTQAIVRVQQLGLL